MDGVVVALIAMLLMAAVAVGISIISAVITSTSYGKAEENDED